MPYNRNSVPSNGYSSDVHPNNESPTYVMEHLATFTVAKETGIVYPQDGMRRLLQLEKSNGIWSQKMHFRMDQNWVLIMDYETGVVMERFPVSMIQEPTAFTSHDPMEIYNNILVFIVGDERQQNNSHSEMHIFQCQSISAQDLAEDLKMLRNGHNLPNLSKPRHIPPPPPTPPPEPPLKGSKVKDQVSAFNAATHSEIGQASSEFDNRDDETSSTTSEKYERDVTVLNHCFDDIEKFIARLQHAAAASRELERRQKSRKSKKKDLGDGMLTMRAKPPPEIEFVDIFQKFKLSFNLLAKLKAHIHDPNAPELVHFLFTPLALIVDASHDTHYGPNLPASVVTPLLTKESVNLLMNCVTSKETELWHSLGDAWLIPREQWKGSVPPYHPIFMDGWSPDYPVSDNRGSTPSEQMPLSLEKRRIDEARLHREVHSELRESQYNRNLDHGHDDSSDYFEYEQQGSDMVTPAAPPLPIVNQYPYEPHSRHYSQDEREICHSPDLTSDPDFGNVMPMHVSGASHDREHECDRDREAHSDISADSIERNGGISERFERSQMRWLDELRSRDAKIVQVTYPRTANNDKELTVVRGEFLEVLDDTRKWWKTRNRRGHIAHVPHTIVTPFNSIADSCEVFNSPLYGRNHDRGNRSFDVKDSITSVDHEHPNGGPSAPATELRRRNRSPSSAPAPAEWVRKEHLGKKESDDSDGEGGLGNVSRVIMRPPGHSGKAKKGHLCFDASFETGNLGKVDLISDFEYDLYIRPDTCNPYHRMWFNFVVDNTKLDQRVMFNIVNISKHRNLLCDGMTPIVKSSSKKKWSRMPPHQVYFYESPYHNNHYVLTLSFCFDKEEEAYQFAYSYPYSYSKHQAHLENIEQKALIFFKRELLANSVQKRRIDIITIGNPIKTELCQKLHVVVIFSRVHPGDSPTSYICQGIIDFLLSNHPIVKNLRSQIVFKIVPMMNPDGVILGNFRSNLLGSDFERYWGRISPWSHPPLHAAFETVSNLKNDKNIELDFVIDLQAHCNLRGIFVYGNTYPNVYRQERHLLFPKLLSQNVDGYESEYCLYNRDRQKRNSCRRFFSNLKESINCYSIYASFYAYVHKATKKLIYFNEDSYYRLGRNIVRTFHDYYTYLGVIPPVMTSSATLSRRKSNAPPSTAVLRARRKKRGAARVAFSKVRKRSYRRRRHKRKTKTTRPMRTVGAKEVTVVEVRYKRDVRKGLVDFSDVVFPPISERKTIARRPLLMPQLGARNVVAANRNNQKKPTSDLKIFKIA